MSWTVKASSGSGSGYEKAPAGNHPAVLVGVIDLGTQWQEGFGTEEGRYQRRLLFVYELVTKRVAGTGARNHLIAIDLTLSFNEKAKMRKWVEARLGRKIRDNEEYDIAQELGKPVLLNVVENRNGYPKIDNVSALPEGLAVPLPQMVPTAWRLGDNLDALPAWLPYLYGRPIREVVLDSQELAGSVAEPARVPVSGPVGGLLGVPAGGPVGGLLGVQIAAVVPTAAVASAAPISPPGLFGPSGPPRPKPRPAGVVESPKPGSRWYFWDEGVGVWIPLTFESIYDWYQEHRVDTTEFRVYPDGKSERDAKAAKEYGFPAMHPF